jgi:hypothetical protein
LNNFFSPLNIFSMSKNLKSGLGLGAVALLFAVIGRNELAALPGVLLFTYLAAGRLMAWSDEGSEETQGDEGA